MGVGDDRGEAVVYRRAFAPARPQRRGSPDELAAFGPLCLRPCCVEHVRRPLARLQGEVLGICPQGTLEAPRRCRLGTHRCNELVSIAKQVNEEVAKDLFSAVSHLFGWDDFLRTSANE